MTRRRTPGLGVTPTPGVCISIVLAAGVVLAAQQPGELSTQVFRGGTALVPIDVRVLDAKGQPVTDLTRADFAVFENGIRQNVTHFLTQSLAPEVPVPGEPLVRRFKQTDTLQPEAHRVFLLVLGRGRLQPPSNGVDGLIHFVRERLLPQDRVAVLAWDRATEFTTDHEAVALLLERFKKLHEGIEAKLKNRFAGLAAIYGSLEIGPELRTDIDKVFNGPRAPSERTLVPPDAPNPGRMADDTRRATDLLTGIVDGDTVARAQAQAIGASLDQFVSANAQSMQDVGNLYTGVRYLQYVDGEKHLIFTAERTPLLPRAEDDKDLAAFASDARVVIHYIHTGGTVSAFAGRGSPSGADASNAAGLAPSGPGGVRYQTTFIVGSANVLGGNFALARTLANSTGGRFFGNRNGKAAIDLDYIDTATRFAYVLGYVPLNPRQDGRYRRIDVRVTRPDLTVLFRHGYYARSSPEPMDQRRMMTYSRVVSAANFEKNVPDIGVRAVASPLSAEAPRDVTAKVTIDLSRLRFAKTADGRNTASVELAVFCFRDHDQVLVGQWWRTLELTYTDDRLAIVKRDGLEQTVTVSAQAIPEDIRVVVFNFDEDRVGSMLVKLAMAKK